MALKPPHPGGPSRRDTRPLGPAPMGHEPTGGVMVRGATQRLPSRARAPLQPEQVERAVAAILSGKGAYQALLTMHRAGADDVSMLFATSMDADAMQRWGKLWVLCPFIARAMRGPAGAAQAAQEIKRDITHAHFFNLFVRKKSESAKRIFERARHHLLHDLLVMLYESVDNERRLQVLVSILEQVETHAEALREGITAALGSGVVDALLNRLIVREDPRHQKVNSRRLSQNLGAKLQALKPNADASPRAPSNAPEDDHG